MYIMQIARITVATLSGNFWKPFTALHLSPKEIGVKQLQSFIPTVHNRILIWKIKKVNSSERNTRTIRATRATGARYGKNVFQKKMMKV